MVIRNGVLQEYIVAGTSKDDFQTRLKTTITASTNPSLAPTSTPLPPTAQQANSHTPPQTVATTATNNSLNQTQAPIAPTTLPRASNSNHNNFDRSPSVAQNQINQGTSGLTEQTHRENIREGKRPEKTETAEEKKALQEKEERRAMQLKIQREQREQKEERERIRNRIKYDQEARRKRAAEEKENYKSTVSTPKTTTTEASSSNNPGRKKVSEYRLQIRLFDGSSVRNSFPPSATITKDIRPWLESQRSDGSQPYNLKHILTPLPNRTISAAEEERSLEELELGPTASLVMVPVPSYIEAYAPSGVMDSLPGRAISSGYGFVSGVVGGVTGIVGGLLGYGSASAQSETTPDSTSDQATGSTTNAATSKGQTINIRTLHDQWRDQDKNEFYNGNTVRVPVFPFFRCFHPLSD